MAFTFRKLAYLRKIVLATCTGRINVHFLHIGKTGGTALKFALSKHQVTPVAVLHLHPHRVRLKDVPANHRMMFIMRDPVARYVSGFGSRLRKGAPAHQVPWTPDEEIAFSRFQDPNSLALALDPSHTKHHEALHAMKNISHVRSSYWDWFGDENALMKRRGSILFIGQIDSFEADFEAFTHSVALPNEVRLPSNSEAAHRAESNYRAEVLLEPRAIELVRAWYQRDYRFVEFCHRWRTEQGGPVARAWHGARK